MKIADGNQKTMPIEAEDDASTILERLKQEVEVMDKNFDKRIANYFEEFKEKYSEEVE